jgi:DNA-binding response OmpR family regulator
MARIMLVVDYSGPSRQLERGLRVEGYDVSVRFCTGSLDWPSTRAGCDCLVLSCSRSTREARRTLSELRRSGWMEPALLIAAAGITIDRSSRSLTVAQHTAESLLIAELQGSLSRLLDAERAESWTTAAGELRLDSERRCISFGANSVRLTRREFEVFAYLFRHKNTPVSREMLGRDVWDEPNYSLTNVIDVYVNFLRRKLEEAGLPPFIHTVRGIGYSLREPGDEPPPARARRNRGQQLQAAST